MDKHSFLSLLFGLHLRIRMYVIKRVKNLTPQPNDPETLVDELVECIETECTKIPFDWKDPAEVQKAIWRKAKDAWANYCRQLKRKKQFEKDLPQVTIMNDAEQKFADQDTRQLWNRLRQRITPSEESLYLAVVKEGYSFNQLGELLDVKPATLRQMFHRTRRKLLLYYAEELMIVAK